MLKTGGLSRNRVHLQGMEFDWGESGEREAAHCSDNPAAWTKKKLQERQPNLGVGSPTGSLK